jgi:vanillate O-demethylase monooxygenase subunit
MFLALDQKPSLRPETSRIAPNDWRILLRYWYPVAIESALTSKPMKGKLLDVELVVYRAGRKVAVALDSCPHRWMRLSAGKVMGERLVCPYHGLAFDAAGQCVDIPSMGCSAHIPTKYRLRTFRSDVRYGLVWACLDDESTEQIPSFLAADEAGPDRLRFSFVRDWPTSSARQVENFVDLAHVPFVHAKTIGGDPHAILVRGNIEPNNNGFVWTTTYETAEQKESWVFTVTLPFMIEFHSHEVGKTAPDYKIAFYPAPTSADQSRVFLWEVTEGLSTSKEPQERPYSDALNLEDIAILGELAEHDLPLDGRGQIHLPIDKVSHQYRRQLRNLGLSGR